ncbi:MAG: DUF3429 domain-containing protein [Pikeienuella sp.]
MKLPFPRPPLLIGLAGLAPFAYGALSAQIPAIASDFAPPLMVLEIYGPMLFAFLSGAFWGFASGSSRVSGRAGWRWLGLAAAPAALLFVATIVEPGEIVSLLLFGFPALLAIDFLFWRAKLAPRWWLPLRVLLTALATACLWLALNGVGEAL